MSAIIAGKSCKICKQKYFVSLGHSDWFDNVVKRQRPPCEIYKRFDRIRRCGICLSCLTGRFEPGELTVATIRLILYGRKIKRRNKTVQRSIKRR